MSKLLAADKQERMDSEKLKMVRDVSSPASLFMELAVQASELSCAAMRMASHYAGCSSRFPDNAEVYKVQELLWKVIEEYTDVMMVARCIGVKENGQLWFQKLVEWGEAEGVSNDGEWGGEDVGKQG